MTINDSPPKVREEEWQHLLGVLVHTEATMFKASLAKGHRKSYSISNACRLKHFKKRIHSVFEPLDAAFSVPIFFSSGTIVLPRQLHRMPSMAHVARNGQAEKSTAETTLRIHIRNES